MIGSLAVPEAGAQGTPLSGSINSDTTLTLANSPYLVQSAVFVGNGATLTIQPGVELRFVPGDNYIQVYSDSKLAAEGAAAQPIRFTSAAANPQRGDWRGLYLDGQATFNFCDIAYGGWPNEQAMRIRHSATALRNSTLRESANEGVRLDNPGSTPTFENDTFSNNSGPALLFITPEHSPTFTNLSMSGNGVNGISIGGSVNRTVSLPAAGHPYFVRGAIFVGNFSTWTLQPGVDMRFMPGDNYILVYGDSKLAAEGTAAQPIRFTSGAANPQRGDWRSLYFDGEANLNYCDISYVGWTNEYAVRIRHSATAIRNSTLRESAGHGIFLDNPGSTPVFENDTFTNNGGAALYFATPEHSPTYANLSMSGNGMNGISIGGSVNRSISLPPAGHPYFVRNAIFVGNFSTWTLQPGVDMRFMPGDNYILVYGDSKLLAEGQPGAPIRFTSAAAAPQRGDWRGLYFDGQAILDHCDVSYAGWANEYAMRIRHKDSVLRNSTVRESASHGVFLDNPGSAPTFANDTFTNNAGAALYFATPEHTPTFSNLTMNGNGMNGISIGGSVNRTVSLPAAGHPYFVRGAIFVGNFSTWTLQPGVDMRFMPGDNYILVYGDSKLLAEGGPSASIKLTSAAANPQPGDWRGMFLDGAARLTYCEIAYGGWANEQAVRLSHSESLIKNCLIRGSVNSGVNVVGGAQPLLTGNQIEQNGYGVWTATPAALVNAVLNWWGDANGPKHTSNPFNNQTAGLQVGDGILFDPWIGKRETVGPLSTVLPAPSFVPWPLFTSDPARVDGNGLALAVWKDVLPAQGQGSVAGFTLPTHFAGVEFALDWKAGDHATLSGNAAGTDPFCVDGNWTLTLKGPTPISRSGSGCQSPLDFATLNLAEGKYGGQLTMTAPAGAASYGAGNVFLIGAPYSLREQNLPIRKLGLKFQADPVTIPTGSVGAVPVKLIATPRPYTGMITHFALDPKAILIESFSVPAGWSGYGSGTLDGIFREYSNGGPLKVGETAFTMNVRCLQPGNWPVTFEGNGFGLGAVADPNQSQAYLQIVADVFTVTCGEAPPATNVTPLGATVDPTNGTLYVGVNGSGFGGAAKAELRDNTGLVATSQSVSASPNGGTLTAHFGTVPGGTFSMQVLDGSGNAIATTGSSPLTVPPSMPVFTVEQGDQLAQLPGKAVTHFWRLRNVGTVDGVALVEFWFPSYIAVEPTLVKSALPKGSLLLMHGALPDGEGWIQHVAVPVKAGSFANVSWTYTLPPDAVFGSNPVITGGQFIKITTTILGEPTLPQWTAMLNELAAGGTLDAMAGSRAAVDLGTANQHLAMSRLGKLSNGEYLSYRAALAAKLPDLAFQIEPYAVWEMLGLLTPDAAAQSRIKRFKPQGAEPLQDPPEPNVSNGGLPQLANDAKDAGEKVKEYYEKAAELYQLYKDCGFQRATTSIVKDEVWKEMDEIGSKGAHASIIWFGIKTGLDVAKGLTDVFVNRGFESFEKAREVFFTTGYATSRGLTPDKPLSKADLEFFMNALEESPGEYGLTLTRVNNIDMVISYITTGNALVSEVSNPAHRLLAYQAMEFAHFQQLAEAEKKKTQPTAFTRFLEWATGLNANKPPVPRKGDDDPCPEKNKVVYAYDPNEISVDPVGVPDLGWTPGVPLLRYVIHFENLPAALAAAEDIRITARLDPNLDASTLTYEASSYDKTQFAFDPATRVMTWLLPGINLPPNTQAPLGEGWVSYTVSPVKSLPTGTPIRAQGSVFFDYNPPIVTPELVSTMDLAPPASQVQPLAATQPFNEFTVLWSGADAGSGVQHYTVYSSKNGGPYQPWLTNTASTSASFVGEPGAAYAFFSVARDRVGNVEGAPLGGGDAATVAGNTSQPPGLGDVNMDNGVNVLDAILVLRSIVTLETLTAEQKVRADMNLDTKIDVSDVIKILRKAVGLPL